MLIVLAVILAIALAAGAMLAVARLHRRMDDLESRVIDTLDVLDAEQAATSEAKRIISEARGGSVVEMPHAKWSARRAIQDNKRITGAGILLAIVTSAGVAAHRDGAESGDPAPTTTTTTSTTSTAPPTSTPPVAPTTSSTTSTTTTSRPAPVAPPTTSSPYEPRSVSTLQLGDELQASVLGKVDEVHDLPDVLAAQIRDDLADGGELLDMIESGLTGDAPSSTEDRPPL